MHWRCIHALVLVVLAATALSCGMPRDSQGTLDRVRRTGTLRAGAVSHPPFVVTGPGGVAGPEAELVEQFAKEQGARVEWAVGAEEELVERLERFELDVVIGGITKKNPHAKKLGTSLPLYEGPRGKKHVIVTPPGENGLLVALDRTVHRQRDGARRALGGGSP